MKVILIDKRISDGYYTYKLYEPRTGIETVYGDLAYFGGTGQKSFTDALFEIIDMLRSHYGEDVDITDVLECGAFSRPCHEVEEEARKLLEH